MAYPMIYCIASILFKYAIIVKDIKWLKENIALIMILLMMLLMVEESFFVSPLKYYLHPMYDSPLALFMVRFLTFLVTQEYCGACLGSSVE